MKTITTDDALRDLETGYCLWIGAGIGVNLGVAAGCAVPGWDEVVHRLERAADLASPAGVSYADRIERCLRTLRRPSFQRHLRAAIVRPLAEAIVKLANDHVERRPCLPVAVRQLAHLGAIANPIVNFNVETTTSLLVAGPSGIPNIRCFAPPLPGATTLLRPQEPARMAFRRNVYHPHGAVDASGICVMASSEYDSLRGTLGLQLALHNAFESKLAIVGMSLEDAYLREQIRSFREQIATVYWFVDGCTDGTRAWAWANDITLVEQPWPKFWERVEAILPGPISEERAYRSWLWNVNEAFCECFGRPQTCRAIAVARQPHNQGSEPVDSAVLEEWRWLSRIRGEDSNDEMSLEESLGHPDQGILATDAIRRGMDGARRVDGFCTEVARTGRVFFAWETADKVLAIIRAPSAREFWSSKELAQRTLRIRFGSEWETKVRAVEIGWPTVSEPWRVGDLPSFNVHVDDPGDPTTSVDVPATTIVAKVDALNMP